MQSSTMGWSGTENDLPLMSNTNDILIRHFILDLKCSMSNKTMSGSVILFLDPAQDGSTAQVFSIQEFQAAMNEKLDQAQKENSAMVDSYEQCRGKMDGELILHSSTDNPNGSKLTSDPSEQINEPFELILDCCDIEVSKVESLEFTKSNTEWLELYAKDLDRSSEEYLKISKQDFSKELHHKIDQWSLRIWADGIYDVRKFPHCVKIHYQTQTKGASLRWAIDQDGNNCVYTAGMWINNRSLMPCQEYGSLSTWQAMMRVNSDTLAVLMSGDEDAKITRENDMICHYYKSRMPLPSFTVALAIGHWDCEVVATRQCDERPQNNVHRSGTSIGNTSVIPETTQNFLVGSMENTLEVCRDNDKIDVQTGEKCDLNSSKEGSSHDKYGTSIYENTTNIPYLTKTCLHDPECFIPYNDTPTLPCRIFAPKSLLSRAVSEFKEVLPRYSKAVQQLLGPCPYPRMDIVIYPQCSQDMAMSNPNLLFISQSVLAGDGSMCIRLGHELSHYWFGLFLGARDWTEEWLSEGFATFVEDIIEANVQGWTDVKRDEHSELTAYLRYKTLAAELAHTSSDLQTLRPNKGEGLEKSKEVPGSVMYIKNGMNPNKLFTQVHYLKGYFLLRWVSSVVGHSGMQALLWEYIVEHHGEMVTSRDFLKLAFKSCPQLLQHYTMEEVCQDWLDCAGIPNKLNSFTPSEKNGLYKTVLEQFTMWQKLDRSLKRQKSAAKRQKIQCEFVSLNTSQLLLLLDKLLTKSALCNATMSRLDKSYKLSERNPEIQHRWFELVIKHKYGLAYVDLGRYLVDHQAMGVYLYGEMVIARCPKLKSVAVESYQKVSMQMETTTRDIVHKMLYGM